MGERFDIAIIGTGAAGLSAAINAKIRNKKLVLFGSISSSSKVEKAHEINNYLGLPGITGKEMSYQFLNHLKEMDISITDKRVTNIYDMDGYFSILADNQIYESTTVILATGVELNKSIEGEDEFLGQGVSYCATCDGNFYKGKTVSVVGYSQREEQEADYLADLASKVYYVPMYQEEPDFKGSIEVVRDKPVSVKGTQMVNSLVLEGQELKTDGVFILRDAISPSKLIDGIEMNDNHIVVDRYMCTSIRGCFAAGDIVGKPYQYIKAAGEGNIAALSAVNYISEKKKDNN